MRSEITSRNQKSRNVCLWIVLGLAVGSGSLASQTPEQLAESLEQRDRYNEAAAIWKSISKQHPTDGVPLAHLGLLESRQQHYQAAVNYYRRALALRPGLPDVAVNLGLAYFKLGLNREAIHVLSPLQIKNPADLRLNILLGMAYYGRSEFRLAIPCFWRAASLDPQNQELLLDLGHSCLIARQMPCVIETYNRLTVLDSNSVEIHMLKGEALDEMKESNAAVEEFRRAAAANSREPNVHFGLGYLLWTQKEFPEAAQEFKAELANDPGHNMAKLYLADALIQLGQLPAAKEILLPFLDSTPDSVMAHIDMGIIAAEEDDSATAIAQYRDVIALDPANTDAHWRLARILRRMGHTSEANIEFEKTKHLNQAENKSLANVLLGGEQNRVNTPGLKKNHEQR